VGLNTIHMNLGASDPLDGNKWKNLIRAGKRNSDEGSSDSDVI